MMRSTGNFFMASLVSFWIVTKLINKWKMENGKRKREKKKKCKRGIDHE